MKLRRNRRLSIAPRTEILKRFGESLRDHRQRAGLLAEALDVSAAELLRPIDLTK